MWNETKERWKERSWIRRYLCLVLVAVLVTTQCTQSMGVNLVIAQTSCPSHEQHDETCGYKEEVTPHECGHTCGDGTCSYEEAVKAQDCDHTCGEDCVKDENGLCSHNCADGTCSYQEAVPEQPCDHSCNESCSYVEIEIVSACTHICDECNQEIIDETIENEDDVIDETPEAEDEVIDETPEAEDEVIDETPENEEEEIIDEDILQETEEDEALESAQGCQQHMEHDDTCGYKEGDESAVCNHTCTACNPAGDLSPAEAVFNKNTESEDYKDIEVTFRKGADTLSTVERKIEIETEEETETEGKRETIAYVLSEDGETVTLKKETLGQLEEGNHTLYFMMESGVEKTFLLTIIDLQQVEEETFDTSTMLASEEGAVELNKTNFPDENFLAFVSSEKINTTPDNILTVEELNAVTEIVLSGTAEVPSEYKNLDGIKYFTNLQKLTCHYSMLESLDVSGMTSLTTLNCNYDYGLTSVDASDCKLLTTLNCNVDYGLTSVDVSGCTSLTSLSCYGSNTKRTSLTSLNLDNCSSLRTLLCYYTSLTNLNVDDCTDLRRLDCGNSSLTSLDVSACTLLSNLTCSRNMITSLDLTNNTALTILGCEYNGLTTLNVSACTLLQLINCGGNDFKKLDVTNNGELVTLHAYENALVNLDVTKNDKLQTLNIRNNNLASVNIGKKESLKSISCYDNNLKSLDVSECAALTTLYCYDNQLESLDVSNNEFLTTLKCYSNNLTDLNIGALNLTTFDAGDQNISSLQLYYDEKDALWTNKDRKFATSMKFYTDAEMTNQVEFVVDKETKLLTVEEEVILPMFEPVYFKAELTDAKNNKYPLSGKFVYNLASNFSVSTGYIDVNKAKTLYRTSDLSECFEISSSVGNTYTIYCPEFSKVREGIPGQYDVTIKSGTYFCNTVLEVGVYINATNFPNTAFRGYVEKYNTKDEGLEEAFLTAAEINSVIKIDLEGTKEAPKEYQSLQGIEYFTNLKELVAEYCGITQLDVSQNKALTYLNVGGNTELKTLDVSGLAELTKLYCYENGLDELNVSNNTLLRELVCHTNGLDELNVSNNTFLTKLWCNNNSLKTLDVSGLTELTELHCYANQSLASLDVSKCTRLISLHCYENSLTRLNVSGCRWLKELYCQSNRLTELDVKNNTKLTELDCSSNQLKRLDLSSNTLLKTLLCQTNHLTELKMGQNTVLTTLDCHDNRLTDLNVDGLEALTECDASGQTIGTMALYYDTTAKAWVNAEKTTKYVFSKFNPAAETSLYNNSTDKQTLSNVFVDKETGLLAADSNDTPSGTGYFESILTAPNNEACTLSGTFSYLIPKLSVITGYMDVNDAADLENEDSLRQYFKVYGNDEGSNTEISSETLEISVSNTGDFANKIQKGITGQYPVTISHEGVSVEAVLELGVDINLTDSDKKYVNFPDDTFRAIVSEFDTGTNKKGFLTDAELDAVTVIDLGGTSTLDDHTCKNVSGIEYFTKLKELYAQYGQMTELDVSKNTALTYLNCGYNSLTGIDVSKNAALTYLDVAHNPELGSLNVEKNTALTKLYCYKNALTELNVNNNPMLTTLWCYNNQLTSLDLGNNTVLADLRCSDNQIAQLNVDHNPLLRWLECSNNQLTSLNVSGLKELRVLDCQSNGLTSLDIQNCTLLTELRCSSNDLTELDVSRNTALKELECHSNQLTALDVSNNRMLRGLYCHTNSIAELNLSNCLSLVRILCQNNRLTSLDISSLYMTEFDASGQTLGSLSMYYVETSDESGTWTNVKKNASDVVRKFIPESSVFYNYTYDTEDGSTIVKGEQLEGFAANEEGILTADLTAASGDVYFESVLTEPNKIGYTISGTFSYSTTKMEVSTGYIDVNAAQNLKEENDLIDYFTMNEIVVPFSDATTAYEVSCAKFSDIQDGKLGQYSVTIKEKDGEETYTALLEVGVEIDYTVPVNGAATYVNFPDAGFRAYVKKYDTDKEGENAGFLTLAEVNAVTVMDLGGTSETNRHECKNLTGIGYFTKLEELYARFGNLTELDVSSNTALTYLDCRYNYIESIDLSKNTALTYLDVSSNTGLGSSNGGLDVSKNTLLETLLCNNNHLETLDLSNNPQVTHLQCQENKLTSLKIDHLTLKEYEGGSQKIDDLSMYYDGASEKYINRANNSKDVAKKFVTGSTFKNSSGDVLNEDGKFYLNNGVLTIDPENVSPGTVYFESTLTEKDGKTTRTLSGTFSYSIPEKVVTDGYIDVNVAKKLTDVNQLYAYVCVQNAPALASGEEPSYKVTCEGFSEIRKGILGRYDVIIEEDGTTYNTVVLEVGVDISYSEDNGETYINFPDAMFRAYVASEKIDGSQDGFLTAEELNAVKSMTLSGTADVPSEYKNLVGIKYFTNLQTLTCHYSMLESLDVSGMTSLTTLNCNYAYALTSIDASGCTSLTTLNCWHDSALTSVDVNGCTALTSLSCYGSSKTRTGLTSLNLDDCSSLQMLLCHYTSLTNLNVDDCTDLRRLNCSSSSLTSLDVSACTLLAYLTCSRNMITSLDLTNNTELIELGCEYNGLTTLDISACTLLQYINCGGNDFKKLDLTNNGELVTLHVYESALVSLDIKNNTKLQTLNIRDNNLTSVNIGEKPELKSILCYRNDLKSLDVSGCKALTSLTCYNNQLESLDVSNNTSLTTLKCYSNNLTDLNIGTLNLTTFEAGDQNISSLQLYYDETDAVWTNKAEDQEADKARKFAGSMTFYTDAEMTNQVEFVVDKETQLLTAAEDVVIPMFEPVYFKAELTDAKDDKYPLSGKFVYNLASNFAASTGYIDVNKAKTLYRTSDLRDCFEISSSIGDTYTIYCPDFDKVKEGIPGEYDVTITSGTYFCNTVLEVGVNINAANFPNTAFREYVEKYNTKDEGLEEAFLTANELDSVIKIDLEGTKEAPKEYQSLQGIEYFTNLKELVAEYCGITQLDVSKNKVLTYLNVGGNTGLKTLDVSANAELTKLYCYENGLDKLDVSSNTLLWELVCHTNSLDELNVSNNAFLTKLWCNDNSLKTLDVSANAELTELYCYANQPLASLDVSKCTRLTSLHCYGNSLTRLNVSGCRWLKELYCQSNRLTELDVKNSKKLTVLDCSSNQLKRLDVSGSTLLETLLCQSNHLTELKMGQNTVLTTLDCHDNRLTELNVAGLEALAECDASSQTIGTMALYYDTTAKAWINAEKSTMYVFSKFNFDAETALYNNSTDKKTLSNVFVDKETGLLTADSNDIPSGTGYFESILTAPSDEDCTLSGTFSYLIPKLSVTTGYMDVNGVADLENENSLRQYFKVYGNDEGSNTEISSGALQISVSNPGDFANKIQKGITGQYPVTISHEGVSTEAVLELGVDINLTDSDKKYVNFPDNVFRAIVSEFDTGTDKKGFLTDAELNAVTVIDLGGTSTIDDHTCKNVSGIEYFTKLKELYAQYGQLTELDVSKNTALTYLNCGYNSLTGIDVSKNTALTYLDVGHNPELGTLNVENNVALTKLYCYENGLTTLNVSKNTALTELSCYENALTELNVNNNPMLTTLWCYNNQLTSLDMGNNTVLTDLRCGDNQITQLDVDSNPSLRWLECANNQLTSLNVSELTELRVLDCQSNGLASLSVENCTLLTELRCSSNELTELDVSRNTALKELECHSNQLTALDVSNNKMLKILYCYANSIAELDVLSCPALVGLLCQNNRLTSLDVSIHYITEFDASGQTLGSLSMYYVETDDESGTWVNVKKNASDVVRKFNPELPVFYHYTYDTEDGSTIVKGEQLEGFAADEEGILTADLTAASGDVYFESVLTDPDKKGYTLSGTFSYSTAKMVISDGYIDVNIAQDLKEEDALLDYFTMNEIIVPFAVDTAAYKVTCAKFNDIQDGKLGQYSVTIQEKDGGETYTALLEVGVDIGYTVPVNGVTTYVNFPDAEFRAYVAKYDTDKEGENADFLTLTELNAVTIMDLGGTSETNRYECKNLTGIGYFTKLEELYARFGNLTELDVSNNTALTYLDCRYNYIESIDLSKNTALTYLDVSNNVGLGSSEGGLDVSKNTLLQTLDCHNSQLNALVLGTNRNLTTLECSFNILQELDVSGCPNLETLKCTDSGLPSLDVSSNGKLAILYCSNNQIGELLLTNHVELTELYCDSNQLKELTVSSLAKLEKLFCADNQLTSLDVAGLMNLESVDASDQEIEDLLMVYSDSEGQGKWINIARQTGEEVRTFHSDDVTDFYEYSEESEDYDETSPVAFVVNSEGTLTHDAPLPKVEKVYFTSALTAGNGNHVGALSGTFGYTAKVNSISANSLFYTVADIKELDLNEPAELKNVEGLVSVNPAEFMDDVVTSMDQEDFEKLWGDTTEEPEGIEGDYGYKAELTYGEVTLSGNGTIHVLHEGVSISSDRTGYIDANNFMIGLSTVTSFAETTVLTKSLPFYKNNVGLTDYDNFMVSQDDIQNIQGIKVGDLATQDTYPVTITYTNGTEQLEIEILVTVLNDEAAYLVEIPEAVQMKRQPGADTAAAEESVKLRTNVDQILTGEVKVYTDSGFYLYAEPNKKEQLLVNVYTMDANDRPEKYTGGTTPLATLDAQTTEQTFKLISGNVSNLKYKNYTGSMNFTITNGESN